MVFENALIYNKKGTIYHKEAGRLLSMAKSLLSSHKSQMKEVMKEVSNINQIASRLRALKDLDLSKQGTSL